MTWLYPITTGITLFDIWTVPHICFWVVYMSTFWALDKSILTSLTSGLTIALLWEFFEKYAEHKWPSVWESPESFLNSFISDPLTVFIGFGIWAFLTRDK